MWFQFRKIHVNHYNFLFSFTNPNKWLSRHSRAMPFNEKHIVSGCLRETYKFMGVPKDLGLVHIFSHPSEFPPGRRHKPLWAGGCIPISEFHCRSPCQPHNFPPDFFTLCLCFYFPHSGFPLPSSIASQLPASFCVLGILFLPSVIHYPSFDPICFSPFP